MNHGAVEIRIINKNLNAVQGQIRWVDHQATVADALTKVKGSLEALYNCTFKLVAEEVNLANREVAPKSGQTSSEIRRCGVKNKFWGALNRDMGPVRSWSHMCIALSAMGLEGPADTRQPSSIVWLRAKISTVAAA